MRADAGVAAARFLVVIEPAVAESERIRPAQADYRGCIAPQLAHLPLERKPVAAARRQLSRP